MVKLRGINVYPTGIGVILREMSQLNGEYFCRVHKDDTGRDTMSVVCEAKAPFSENIDSKKRIETILRQKLGVGVEVILVEAGGTAEITQINARQKPIRLVDER